MARDTKLRQQGPGRPASTGRFVVPRSLLPLLIAAILAVTAVTVFAVHELAGSSSPNRTTAPAFLTKQLGAPQAHSSLVRRPAPDVVVAVKGSDLTVSDADGVIALATAGLTGSSLAAGAWKKHAQGAIRPTSFGSEAIVFDDPGQGAEQLLVVTEHHGQQTWRWQLHSKLEPRVTPTGAVAFFAGRRMAVTWIPSVQVLDAKHRDVTPKGATWRTVQSDGKWWLELSLNDRHLPLPYTIDPAVLRTGGAGTVATITGAGTTLSVTIPSAAVAQDFLFLHFAQLSTATPACPAGWNTAQNAVGGSSAVTITTLGEVECWRKAISTDPGSPVTITRASGITAAAVVMAYRGVDTSLVGTTPGATSPLRQAATAAYNPGTNGFNANTTFPALSATTAIANEEVIGFGSQASNATWPGTSGSYTIQRSGSTTGLNIGVGDRNVTTVGTTVGTQATTLTGGASARRQGMTFGLTNDTGAPTNGSETLAGVQSGGAYQAAAGAAIYFKGNAAGSLTLSDAFTDAQSGPYSVTYPALAANGWTHTAETVTALPSFTSGNTFTWSSGATTPTLSLTETDAGGTTATNAVTLTSDTTAPTGGAVTVNGTAASGGGTTSYLSGTTVTINSRTDYSADTGSGVASSTLTMQSATLTNDTCGTYGSPTTITGTTSQTVSDGNCYLFTLTGTDNVGNAASITTTVKVDTTDPGGTFSITAPTDGGTIANGQAVSASTPTDTGSTVAQVDFRYCSGWSCTFAGSTSLGTDTTAPYSVTWNGQPTNGTYTILARATDKAGNPLDSSTVTVLVSNGGSTTVGVDTGTDTTAAQTTYPATTLSWSQTVGSQANRILLVSVSAETTLTAGCSTASVTYGGTPLTEIDDVTTTQGLPTGGNRDCVSLWYLLNPPTGTATVLATMDQSIDTALSGGGVVIYNAKQAAPDASGPSIAETGIASTTLSTSAANSLVVDTYSSGNNATGLAPAAGQTLIWTVTGNATESDGMSYKQVASPSSPTMTWTHTGENRSVDIAAAFSADTTPPTSALSFTEGSSPSGQYEVDTGTHAWSYYYNPSTATDFTMTDTATDDGSGIAVEFPDLTTTGFTGTGARDTSSTYDSNTYTITTSNLAAPAAKTVVVYDSFGNSTTETVTFVRDVTAPTGGSVSVPAYSGTLGSIAITRTDYTDAASGIATNVITRSSAQAPTSPGVCPVGGYTGTTTVTSPDTVPTDGRCYVYTLTGTDNVGNNASVSSSPILVDTTAPSTPTIAFSGLSTGNTYNNGTGTLYFRPSTGGTFTVTAASTDAQSAIKTGNPGYTFGSLNTNGGANFNTTQTADHIAVTFDATTTGPTTQRTVNSTNNTNTNSTTATYTITQDSTNPTNGSVSVPAYSGTLGSITITRTDYTDAASGIATNVITRSSAQAPTSPGVCPVGGYTGTTTVTSPDTVPTDSQCYQYTLTGTDNVGNNASVSSSPILVDTTAPTTPAFTLSESVADMYADNTAHVLYYKPGGTNTFTSTASSTDSESGVASYTWPTVSGWTGAGGTATAHTYTLNGASGNSSPSITATNNAGGTGSAGSFSITADSTNPTDGSVSVPAYSGTLGSIAITRTNYTDAASGIATNVITRSSAQAPTSPGVCPVGGYTGSHHRHQPRHRPHRRPVLRLHPHRHRQRRQQRLGQLQPDPRRHHRPHHTDHRLQRPLHRQHLQQRHRHASTSAPPPAAPSPSPPPAQTPSPQSKPATPATPSAA